MLVEEQKELELEKKEMINLKSEIQLKNIEREEIQLSLDKTQSELDKLKGYKNLKKLTDTSYASRAFNDYENLMNTVDKDINSYFSHPHNNEILHEYKPHNDEKEDYTQENGVVSSLTK
jgi:hypothetical protein